MPNQLQYAKSPYLKQHDDNPVAWMEWSEEALALAKRENKVIIVSIGYSACHWCHVMAHESFDDEATAKIMNENFVNIKIDREERPDLDAIYMDACQLVTGSGGWPLNAFALPDGTPFHAGTYFPKHQWQNTLMQIAQLWKSEPQKVRTYAADLKDGIEKVSGLTLEKIPGENPKIAEATTNMAERFDKTYGGFNHSPKFPMPIAWLFLLESGNHYNIKTVENHVYFTLEQMALGGIYDCIEGGFARYSVDERWFAPHFEKMLYDNAQLISLYAKAYLVTQNPNFLSIAKECADFISVNWLSPKGGYYSAYDADSEGVEGKYYCLTWQEVNQLEVKEKEHFISYYQLTENGNWEHGLNILYPILSSEKYAEQEQLIDFSETVKGWKTQVRNFRKQKIKPGLDDKQNTTWNALLLSAFCHLHQANQQMDLPAKELFDYLTKQCFQKNKLYHIIQNGAHHIEGFLEDYSCAIQAGLDYFETFNDKKALIFAEERMQDAVNLFFNEESGFFSMSSSTHQQIVASKIEVMDNVIPSSNSIMAENLLKLGLLLDNTDYINKGENMLLQMQNKAINHPDFYANWLRLLLIKERGYPYLISSQKTPNKIRAKVWITFNLNKNINIPFFEGKQLEKTNNIYYCANKTCNAPVTNFTELKF